MLPSVAILGCSGASWGFGLSECGSSLAFGVFRNLARGRRLSSLSGNEVPSATKQDCTCPVGARGGAGYFADALSPSSGGLAGRRFQPAKSSIRTAVSFHSHAREL